MTTSGRIFARALVAVVTVCALPPQSRWALLLRPLADHHSGRRRQRQLQTVQAAVDSVAANNSVPVTITIKPGTYRGVVTIPANKPYLTLAGAGGSASQVVIVEGHASGQAKTGGGTYGTSGSASVFINANDITITNLTMSNDFSEAANNLDAEQAVAVNTSGDRVQFDNVRILGNQDTLLVNAPSVSSVRRLYVRNSYVEGDVDFIFGRGTMVFQNGTVHSLTRGSSSNNGYITAAATDINNKFGFLFWGTTLTSNAAAKTVYLGRPWHPSGDVNARGQVLYRGVTMGAHIRNDPWTDMSGFSWKTARFAEYSSTGAGAVINANRPADERFHRHPVHRHRLPGRYGWLEPHPLTSSALTPRPNLGNRHDHMSKHANRDPRRRRRDGTPRCSADPSADALAGDGTPATRTSASSAAGTRRTPRPRAALGGRVPAGRLHRHDGEAQAAQHHRPVGEHRRRGLHRASRTCSGTVNLTPTRAARRQPHADRSATGRSPGPTRATRSSRA